MPTVLLLLSEETTVPTRVNLPRGHEGQLGKLGQPAYIRGDVNPALQVYALHP